MWLNKSDKKAECKRQKVDQIDQAACKNMELPSNLARIGLGKPELTSS